MVTVTTNTGWFSRIGNSIVGMLVGIVLIPLAVWFLWGNEGRAVKTERSLNEGAKLAVSVPSASVTPGNEGKLVHTTGTLVIAEPLTDPDFAITAPGVRLTRSAEMYQWVETSHEETRKKLGGSEETVTTYTYAKEWKSGREDSSQFQEQAGHENPEMTVEGTEVKAPSGTLGAYTIEENVLDKLDDAVAVPIREDQKAAIEEAAGREVTIANNQINFGNPTSPNVGDVRVSYTVVPAGPIRVIGSQIGSTFAPFQTKAGDALLLVERGTQTAQAMFKTAQDNNRVLTWIIRVAGIVGLMIGFGLLMAPIGVIADFVPFLGSIARLGTGIIGFVLAIVVGFVTIAIAWFAVRPLLSIGLIVAALGLYFVVARWGHKKDKARAADAAAAAAPAPAAAPAG
jgi:hypothetical protein